MRGWCREGRQPSLGRVVRPHRPWLADGEEGVDGRLALRLGHLFGVVRRHQAIAGAAPPLQAGRLCAGQARRLVEGHADLPSGAAGHDPDAAAPIRDAEVDGSFLVQQDASAVVGRVDAGAVPDTGPRLERRDQLLADGLDDARDPHFAGCEAIEAGGRHGRDEPVPSIGHQAADEEDHAADEAHERQAEHETGCVIHVAPDAMAHRASLEGRRQYRPWQCVLAAKDRQPDGPPRCYPSAGAAHSGDPFGRCVWAPPTRAVDTFRRSSVVERAAVNRLVVGSNPTAGANFPSWILSMETRGLCGVPWSLRPVTRPVTRPERAHGGRRVPPAAISGPGVGNPTSALKSSSRPCRRGHRSTTTKGEWPHQIALDWSTSSGPACQRSKRSCLAFVASRCARARASGVCKHGGTPRAVPRS